MRLALINGRRVAYEVSGDPAGRPVLIIHGAWGGPSSTLWNGPRLRWHVPTDGLRLIWYDRRCAGLSQYDTGPFTLEDLANDAVDLLDYLNIDQAAIIATSAGGPIGLRLALDHPDRVESLVLLNTGASLMSLTPTAISLHDPFVADRLATVAKRLALLDLFECEGIEAVIAESEEEWRSPPQPPEPDPALSTHRENRQRFLQGISNEELTPLARGALLNMKAQRGVDLCDELSRIRCPVLIIHGDADTTVPVAFGRALAEEIPHGEFTVLNGQGHGLIVNPAAQQLVIQWLRSG
ncbi:MAG: alpha/beta hydrolase [Chloroflexota bacterium]|nr:alpha/beta hydrolase [Chloroflexota bacterium]MDE2895858.1 alpha/beta hydrolase [Chloroflexota bacterium]